MRLMRLVTLIMVVIGGGMISGCSQWLSPDDIKIAEEKCKNNGGIRQIMPHGDAWNQGSNVKLECNNDAKFWFKPEN
jgi:hypothetical protein